MKVAAERCSTAVCAVELMGRVAEKYGFIGEEATNLGGGESVSVADGKEAWVLSVVIGKLRVKGFIY
jgi:dipeptidase